MNDSYNESVTSFLSNNDFSADDIKNKIYLIRGVHVMLDSDLAEIYGYETKNFNRQVKNNIERFPSDMMFQLSKDEVDIISRCKKFTLDRNDGRGSNIKYLPYAFTEQGIYMLMTVLKGDIAVQQSIALVRLFKQMKDVISENTFIMQKLNRIELKQLENDEKFRKIFEQLDQTKPDKAVIFFKGQKMNCCLSLF